MSALMQQLQRLTPLQQKILSLLIDGCTTAEIAVVLHLSRFTIEDERSRMWQTLNVAANPGRQTRLVAKIAHQFGYEQGYQKACEEHICATTSCGSSL